MSVGVTDVAADGNDDGDDGTNDGRDDGQEDGDIVGLDVMVTSADELTTQEYAEGIENVDEGVVVPTLDITT